MLMKITNLNFIDNLTVMEKYKKNKKHFFLIHFFVIFKNDFDIFL